MSSLQPKYYCLCEIVVVVNVKRFLISRYYLVTRRKQINQLRAADASKVLNVLFIMGVQSE